MDLASPISLYRMMLKIRFFEEKAVAAYKKGHIGGSIHPCIGQEAVAAGACAAIEKEDYVVSCHRGHGHCIAKGLDLGKMMAEMMGRSTGYCGGRGGPMHIFDLSVGLLGSNGVVGGGIPMAVGAALSSVLENSQKVTLCFFGEGASNIGSFHESLNLAAVWKLPVVFICENNEYAISVPARFAVAGRDVANRAYGYGIPGVLVDGNDALAVNKVVVEAVKHARCGKGPTLIEAKTYRWEGHFVGDPTPYRTKEELQEWKNKCPIRRLEMYLLENNLMTVEEKDKIISEVQAEVDAAEKFALGSPLPSTENLTYGVFVE